MNPKILVAISGYDGDRHQIINNWPCYEHHKTSILVLSPADAPVQKIHNAKMIQTGEKGWIGPQTLERHKKFLRVLLNQSADFYLFHDADSVCLSPELPKYLFDNPDTHWSNEVLDTNPGPSRLPKIAMQPPYMFSRGVLKSLVRISSTPAQSYVHVTAQGTMPLPTVCIDHLQLQLVYAANVPHRTFPDGASWETTSELGLNQMSEQVRAHGKVFIHQIKSKPVLDRLMADRSIFLRR